MNFTSSIQFIIHQKFHAINYMGCSLWIIWPWEHFSLWIFIWLWEHLSHFENDRACVIPHCTIYFSAIISRCFKMSSVFLAEIKIWYHDKGHLHTFLQIVEMHRVVFAAYVFDICALGFDVFCYNLYRKLYLNSPGSLLWRKVVKPNPVV